MEKQHKQWVASIFNKAAPIYGKKEAGFFRDFADKLIELAHVTPQAQVLDIATGRGAVALSIATNPHFQGTVDGIDISQNMIQETQKEVSSLSLTNMRLQVMDAESLNFPDESFDFVFCSFGVFFFPHPLVGLAEMQRVLKKGGTVALTFWGGHDPCLRWVKDRAYELGAKKGPMTDMFKEKEAIEKALKEVGFSSIHVQTEQTKYFFDSIDVWWEAQWGHANRAIFEQLAPDTLASLKAEVDSKAHSIFGEGLPYQFMNVNYAIAKK